MYDKVDAYLVLGNENKRYISGFTGSNSLVVTFEKGGLFVTDGRYILQSKEEVKSDFEIQIIEAGSTFTSVLKENLKQKGIKKLGFDSNHISLAMYEEYKKEIDFVEFIPINGEVEGQRISKSEEELVNIRKAVEITDMTFTEVLKHLEEEMSEEEIRNLVDYYHVKFGGEKPSFDTIVAFGENTALPHATPSDRKLQKGDIITIDFGCFYNGYCSDMTRTFFFGEPKEKELVAIHGIVKETMEMQMKAVKAGVSTKEIDRLGRNFIIEKGYGENFSHGTGHGIGLEIHESPLLNTVSDLILKEGMVITIEPGIYVEGLGGVRIENDVVVKKDGCEILNASSRDYDVYYK